MVKAVAIKTNTISSPTAFASVVQDMRKKFGTQVWLGTELQPRSFRSTGMEGLDDFLGGGIAQGTILKVSGAEGCGKTAFALLVANTYVGKHLEESERRGVLWVDADMALDKTDFERAGLDLERLVYLRTPILEEAMEAAFAACQEMFGLIVIDSIATLVSYAEVKASADMTKVASVAPVAGLFSRKLSLLVALLQQRNMSAVFINQGRAKVGNTNPYVDPLHYAKGGHMLAGIAGQHIIVRKSVIKDKKTNEQVAIKSRLTYDKNKFGAPRGGCEMVVVPGFPMLPFSELSRLQEEANKRAGKRNMGHPLEIEGEEPQPPIEVETVVTEEAEDGDVRN